MGTTFAYGWFLTVKGELDAAETLFEDLRSSASELGIDAIVAAALFKLGRIAAVKGDHKRGEKLLREAVRMTAARGDRGLLSDAQAGLVQALVDVGKLEEAERLALEAKANVVPEDSMGAVATASSLGAVRAAQGRDDEAEDLLRSAVSLARDTDFKLGELAPLEYLVGFLRERGRDEEATPFEERLAELSPSPTAARVA
jgi:tetratricopeptide (TPR) repeat protein